MNPIRLLALAVALVFSAPVPAGAGIGLPGPAALPAWEATGRPASEIVEIAVTPDGAKVVAAGSQYEAGYKADLGAFDSASGEEIWRFTSSRNSRGRAIAISPDGKRVAMAGWVSRAGERSGKVAIWMLNVANGKNLWSATYTGNGADRGDSAADIAFAPGGRAFYVTGVVWNADRRRDLAVLAYDSITGRPRWRRAIQLGQARPGSGFSEEGFAVAVTPDGNRVIVTGYRNRPAGHEKSTAVTLSLTASSGRTQWIADSTIAGQPDDSSSTGIGLAIHRTNVYVAGSRRERNGGNFTTRHAVTDSRRIWSRRYDAGGVDAQAEAIVADNAGAYLAGPTLDEAGATFRVWSHARSNGALRWASSGDITGAAHDLVRSPSEPVVYASGEFFQSRLVVAGYDVVDGSMAWLGTTSTGDEGIRETGVTIAIAPDGNRVFAAGIRASTQWSSLLVAFDIGD